MNTEKIVKTQKPLRILTDAAPEHVERLRAQGHLVNQDVTSKVLPPDLYIANYAWHLPADAPDPAAFIDAAVRWMQKRIYADKPIKQGKKK